MHTGIELERIDFAVLPEIELGTQLTKSLVQVAIVCNPSPFSNQPFQVFWNFMHFSAPYLPSESA